MKSLITEFHMLKLYYTCITMYVKFATTMSKLTSALPVSPVYHFVDDTGHELFYHFYSCIRRQFGKSMSKALRMS